MDFAATIYNRISEAFGNPFIVKEIHATEYQGLTAIEQHGQLRLYKHKQGLDCVLTHPTDSKMLIRMFRISCQNAKSAKNAFTIFSKHLPNFYANFPTWYSTNKLTILSEIMRQNDSWSSAHMAVQANLTEVLNREQMGSLINNQNCSKRRSPMHLACDLVKLEVLEKCVGIGGDLGLQDENGDTVVHYCVSKCPKTFLKYVCSRATKPVLDIQNNKGETALHFACREKKFDFAKILIEAGASVTINSLIGTPLHYALKHESPEIAEQLLEKEPDLVHIKCNSHQSLPIHWSRTRENVALLSKFGSSVSLNSKTGDTPLHTMVKKNRLDAAIGLIFSHASANAKGEHGNSPLHLAIQSDNEALVKMLLLFGANCGAENDFGETPGLLAIRNSKPNKEKILKLMSSVGGILLEKKSSRIASLDSVDSSLKMENNLSNKAKVLCLDGGGIRGLVLTQILIAIEEHTGRQIRDMFDWICGTSTGGMLALTLALGLRAVDCQSIYFRLKDSVFSGSRPYDSKPMEEFLKSVYGETTTLGDLQGHCKVILTSVLADRRPAELFLFRNYEPAHELVARHPKGTTRPLKKSGSVAHQDIIKSPLDTPLWQAARSSGAAPTYFRPMGCFLDGGLLANNPTMDVLTEILQHNKALERAGRLDDIKRPGMVVSIGTGLIPVVKIKSIDVARPTNPILLVNSALAGMELTQILIDSACECNGPVEKRARVWCDSIGVPYFRLNPPLREDLAMNEVNDEKLVDMLWSTKLYLHQNKHIIEELCHLLMLE